VLGDDINQVALDQFLAADAMLLGRKTYEGLAAVWPQLADDPNLGVFADLMNSMPKYVASRSLREPLDVGSEVLGEHLIGPAVDEPDVVDPSLVRGFRSLHKALVEPSDTLEAE
jgi:dihydrofolate reductase